MIVRLIIEPLYNTALWHEESKRIATAQTPPSRNKSSRTQIRGMWYEPPCADSKEKTPNHAICHLLRARPVSSLLAILTWTNGFFSWDHLAGHRKENMWVAHIYEAKGG